MAPTPVSLEETGATTSTAGVHDSEFVIRSPYPDIMVPKDVELHEFIFERIAQYGDLTALTCGLSGKRLTFGEIVQQASGFGAALLQAGNKKGDIAALCLGNVLEFPVAALGCWCAGLAVAFLNPLYTEQETLRQFGLIDARVVITEEKTLRNVLLAAAENPEIQAIILVGEVVEPPENCLKFAEMVKTKSEGEKFSTGKTDSTTETVAWLPLSSGTTGPPKWVMVSHAQMVANLLQLACDDVGPVKCYLGTGSQERTIALMPFFHSFGFWYTVMSGLYQGTHAVTLPGFEPSTFLRVIREHKPTCLHIVTHLISHIVNNDQFTGEEMQSVHTVTGGGAPIGVGLINALMKKAKRNIHFMEIYGMTEVLVSHSLNPSSNNTKIGSCGRCYPSNLAKVIHLTTAEPLGPNKIGEILLKPPVSAKGYYKNEVASRELIDEEGYAHTGDVGYYDVDGYFYIVDRIKELIKVKGAQVAPSELEDLLRKQGKVEDCAVIGVPSEEHGEVPRAYVVVKEGEILLEAEIHEYLRPLVSTFKQLKGGVEFVDVIEKSPTGKILRRELRDKYRQTWEQNNTILCPVDKV